MLSALAGYCDMLRPLVYWIPHPLSSGKEKDMATQQCIVGRLRVPQAHVVAIRGDFYPDVISQRELADVYKMREAAQIAYVILTDAARAIARRIEMGATIEDGRYRFSPSIRLPVDPGDSLYEGAADPRLEYEGW
jgi:hypothetical protein